VTQWLEESAPAKLNLALLVGSPRDDGKHEVVTVMERLSLADTIAVRPAPVTRVAGFADDTLVAAALEAITAAADGRVRFEARIEKRIPVAAGLGGGSSDAATALRLSNEFLDAPLAPDELHAIAASLGADVPFFLREGAQLATGDGTTLEPLELPDYAVLLVLPDGVRKRSTADVYESFDAGDGARGFSDRVQTLERALARIATAADLAGLPHNDLASSPLSSELERLGALRADVSGAGPVVYGVFDDVGHAREVSERLTQPATTWIVHPGGSPDA